MNVQTNSCKLSKKTNTISNRVIMTEIPNKTVTEHHYCNLCDEFNSETIKKLPNVAQNIM